MKPISVFVFVLFFSNLSAQHYLIKYDLLSTKASYYSISKKKDTLELISAVFRKPGAIEIQIENYNPYYWNAKITTYKKSVDEQIGFAGLFNPINLVGKSVLKMLPALMPDITLPEAGSRGFNGSVEQIQFIQLTSKFKTTSEQVDKLVAQYQDYKTLEFVLSSLKFEHTKTEKEIKEYAAEMVKKTTGTDYLDLGDIIAKGRELDNEYNGKISLLNEQYEQIVRTAASIDKSKVIFENQTSEEILIAVQKGHTKSGLLKQENIDFSNQLLTISNLYKEIISASFKYSYIITNSQDISDIKLDLFARNNQSTVDTLVKYFTVNTSGNLRIRNSISICFTHFGGNSHSYFINSDSSIGASTGNLFTPVISTFLHFYSTRSAALKWGGSFGVGIPLQWENKDLNFMLGLSLVLGRNEPVILTAGIAGGKMNKLRNNWQPGDKVLPQYFNDLTYSSYDVGAFFSIGFNLNNIGASKTTSE